MTKLSTPEAIEKMREILREFLDQPYMMTKEEQVQRERQAFAAGRMFLDSGSDLDFAYKDFDDYLAEQAMLYGKGAGEPLGILNKKEDE